MALYSRAYCHNIMTGFDFSHSRKMNYNLSDSLCSAFGRDFGANFPIMQQIDGEGRGIKSIEDIETICPESGRHDLQGYRMKSSVPAEGAGYYVGLHLSAMSYVYPLNNGVDIPAGTKLTFSVYVKNLNDFRASFITRTNESNDYNKYGNKAESTEGTQIWLEPNEVGRLVWTYTTKYKHRGKSIPFHSNTPTENPEPDTGDLGMRVYQAKLGTPVTETRKQTADFNIFMVKVEMGDTVTPFTGTQYMHEHQNSMNHEDWHFMLPYEGKKVGAPSDNWEDYTWDSGDMPEMATWKWNHGAFKSEVALTLCRATPKNDIKTTTRHWVGIDSETWNNESGRTVEFSVINRDFNPIGQWFEIERNNNKWNPHEIHDGTWVNTGDILYIPQQGVAIDTMLGEMANMFDDGTQFATGTTCRIDEVLRDVVRNYPLSLPEYFWDELSVGGTTTSSARNHLQRLEYPIRDELGVIKVNSKKVPKADGGLQPYLDSLWNLAVSTYPRKFNKTSGNPKEYNGKLKGAPSFADMAKTFNYTRIFQDTADWFREGAFGDYRPKPKIIVFRNMEQKKMWWFSWSNGLWNRSGARAFTSSAPTLVSSYDMNFPGNVRGNINFTTSPYEDYGAVNTLTDDKLDFMMPDEKIEKCYYAPKWHEFKYNTWDSYWGAEAVRADGYNFKTQQGKYGAFGCYEVDFQSGTMTLRRIWKR